MVIPFHECYLQRERNLHSDVDWVRMIRMPITGGDTSSSALAPSFSGIVDAAELIGSGVSNACAHDIA